MEDPTLTPVKTAPKKRGKLGKIQRKILRKAAAEAKRKQIIKVSVDLNTYGQLNHFMFIYGAGEF